MIYILNELFKVTSALPSVIENSGGKCRRTFCKPCGAVAMPSIFCKSSMAVWYSLKGMQMRYGIALKHHRIGNSNFFKPQELVVLRTPHISVSAVKLFSIVLFWNIHWKNGVFLNITLPVPSCTEKSAAQRLTFQAVD
ncbi:hypothetical protein [Neglectibacter timonensis]|uniref:hypothetical protein n=1 Tax=Neglectibacter timonensis TaxID=1776382 RepID=UPI00399B15E3